MRGGHSFNGDPVFVDAANDDYHLSANSEALNTGAAWGISTDGDGDARPGGTGIDRGYDETTYISDAAMTKAVDTNPGVSEPITYTLSFANTGTAMLPRLTITDFIPAQVVQPLTISSSVTITDISSDGLGIWQVHNLAPGAGGVITVSSMLTAALPRGTFTNTAVIASPAAESNTANNTAKIGVTVPNLAPIAVADRFVIAEDSTVGLTPLANDIEGDPMTIDSFTPPGQGTAVLSGTRQIVYTPTLHFNGTDSFSYTVSDGEFTDSETVTITITPVNDAPVIAEGDTVPVTMSEDGDPTDFLLTLNAGDVENDPLTWSVDTQPAHGDAWVMGS
ncbi:MAG: Ig-like domain-containing protein, partial [Anaerolineae bacterium]